MYLVSEPERTLLLSEKGAAEDQTVTAGKQFRFFGTMNPGGDFGKKEVRKHCLIVTSVLVRALTQIFSAQRCLLFLKF